MWERVSRPASQFQRLRHAALESRCLIAFPKAENLHHRGHGVPQRNDTGAGRGMQPPNPNNSQRGELLLPCALPGLLLCFVRAASRFPLCLSSVELGVLCGRDFRAFYRASMKGKPPVISGFRNWLLAESLRISPRRVVTAVSRKNSSSLLRFLTG